MINYIKGTVHDIFDGVATVVTANGIGFGITLINGALIKPTDTVELTVYCHWNQENGPTLFGFTQPQEKNLFELVISCQGIGPKMAASILNQMKPEIFINAIAQSDTKTLSSLNGIGAKKAEQIIFQLKSKVPKLQESVIFKSSQMAQHFGTISEVLTSLNYSKQEVASTFDYLNSNFNNQDLAFDDVLRKSLSFLSKRAQ